MDCNKMKAISIKQPWASFIAEGYKTIETRIWSTEYRGDILICASKTPDNNMMKELNGMFSPFKDLNIAYPFGQAICIAEIYDCKPMKKDDEPEAMCEVYGSGRWKAKSFFLRNIRKIKPFPVKGELGIFEINIDQSKIEVIK